MHLAWEAGWTRDNGGSDAFSSCSYPRAAWVLVVPKGSLIAPAEPVPSTGQFTPPGPCSRVNPTSLLFWLHVVRGKRRWEVAHWRVWSFFLTQRRAHTQHPFWMSLCNCGWKAPKKCLKQVSWQASKWCRTLHVSVLLKEKSVMWSLNLCWGNCFSSYSMGSWAELGSNNMLKIIFSQNFDQSTSVLASGSSLFSPEKWC